VIDERRTLEDGGGGGEKEKRKSLSLSTLYGSLNPKFNN
jgi:hypothetical protein